MHAYSAQAAFSAPGSGDIAQHGCRDGAGFRGGNGRTLPQSGDNGPVHQQDESSRERLRILMAVFGEQTRYVRGHVLLVVCGDPVCGTAGVGGLDHGVDERASTEVGAREALRQSAEYIQRFSTESGHSLGQPGSPGLIASLEYGYDQFVLAREVPIEGSTADTGLGQDPFNANGPNALGVEEVFGGVEEALACVGCHESSVTRS